jgi:hypothetical protein
MPERKQQRDPTRTPAGPPPDEPLIPVGVWIRMALPQFPDYVGFTYVDPQAGLSAQGEVRVDGQPELVIVRLPLGVAWQVLDEAAVQERGLPASPPQIAEFYGPQPPAGTLWGWWRTDPRLRGRFHPEYPDDLQVLVHDGGPRLTDHRPELIWVRVTGGTGDVFTGIVLNKPHHLHLVSDGSEIQFIAAGGEHLLQVREKYLAERGDWEITPCNRCGLAALFDAPSDLIRVVFPNTPPGATMSGFTAFCGACGGILLVKSKGDGGPDAETPPASPASSAGAKKWWQFWK